MVLQILPLDPVSARSKIEPECPVQRRRGVEAVSIRVLVAEDAPVVRRALVALISADPHLELVGEAEDAVQAIEVAWDTRPDVALIDVKMPGGGGARATREILRCSPETRVVALSARAERDCVLEMRAAGACCYMLKGIPADQILRTVRECASRPSVQLVPGTREPVPAGTQSPWVRA
jgi:DNA-binding NarL/FixJ family response regulator